MTFTFKKNSAHLINFLFLIFLSFCILSCSSDDEGNLDPTDSIALYNEKIQGTWEMVGRRFREESDEFKTYENYSKTLIFKDGTFTRKIVDSSSGIEHRDPDYSNYYDIGVEHSSNKYILGFKQKAGIGGYYWDYHYIEFADNYNTLFILEKEPSGYLDIDEKYIRKQ